MNFSDQFIIYEDLNKETLELLIPNSVILIGYIILSVFGNGLVLYVYICKLSRRNTTERLLIPILAGFDMASCIIGSSFALSINFHHYSYRVDSLCRILWTLNKFASLSAGFMLLVIAIQRYFKVCRPFRWQLNRTKNKFSVLCVVVTSAVLAIPCVYLIGVDQRVIEYQQANITISVCGLDLSVNRMYDKAYSAVLLIICLLGLLLLSILYGLIMRKIYQQEAIWKSKRPMDDIVSPSTQQNETCLRMQHVTENIESSNENTTENSNIRFPNSGNICSEETSSNQPTKSGFLSNNRVNVIGQILRKHRISLMFLLITVLFALTYFPRVVLMIMESTNENFWDQLTKPRLRICLFLYRAYLLNNVVNPVIYSIFDVSFRKACCEICKHR